MYRVLLSFFFCLFIGVAQAQTNPSPYDLALQRILANESSQNPSLSLAGMNLTELPPQIGRLTHLETLWLNHNELVTLPAEIGALENLHDLSLSHNHLRQIPPEIGSLINLSDLDLSYNQLSSLPAEIGNLINLNQFYLGHNQLTVLPPSMGTLTNLRWLDLADNHLRGLPPEMGRLNLEHIAVAGNLSPLGDIANLDTRAILTYTQFNGIWAYWPIMLLGLAFTIMLLVAYFRRKKPAKKRIKNRA